MKKSTTLAASVVCLFLIVVHALVCGILPFIVSVILCVIFPGIRTFIPLSPVVVYLICCVGLFFNVFCQTILEIVKREKEDA